MIKFLKISCILTISAIIIVSCATKPKDIQATYVSPLAYQNYSCTQISEEAERVSARAAEAAGIQQKKAKNDAIAVGVAAIIFWPALFFVKGDSANGTALARLKGEMQTIERVSIEKKCGIRFSA